MKSPIAIILVVVIAAIFGAVIVNERHHAAEAHRRVLDQQVDGLLATLEQERMQESKEGAR